MIHGEFVYPSYALTIAGLIGVVAWSFAAMRRAEGAGNIAERRAESAGDTTTRRAQGAGRETRR